MKKSGSWIAAIALAVAMPLAGCATIAPAPLQHTTIDEKGLITAWSAFDVAVTAVEGLIDTGRIVPGSATAIKIKGHLQRGQNALNAATSAQKAGSASEYATAMIEAKAALDAASAALKGI